MNQYSSIYAVGAEHSSLHAFSSTNFYLYSYELDFLVHKDMLIRADYYAVEHPKEGNDRQKLVDLRAMGKPLRIGYCDNNKKGLRNYRCNMHKADKISEDRRCSNHVS